MNSTPNSTLESGIERRIERFIGDWLADANVPGASIAILRDDDLVYASGFGSRDLESNAPATPETLYGVASCSKSFTALAVLILEARDELSVEDPVGEYLDDFELEGEDGPIRIHDLLTHSSGIPSLKTSEVLLSRLTGLEEHGIPLGDAADFFRHVNGAGSELAGPRGERFMYNNSGYILLGDVVAEITGESFDAFVEDEILDPLGMDRSTFDLEAADEDVMTPYFLRDGSPEQTPFPVRERSHAAGGLIAPVTELIQYLRLHVNGGSIDGEDIVSAELLERAHRGYIADEDGEYGYGWRRSEVCGRTLVGHGGSLGVSSSFIGFTEDGDYAMAIGANTTPVPTPPTVAKGVLAILEGESPTAVVPYFARDERFEELTGEYESYRSITTATVERYGGVLRISFDGELAPETLLLVPTDSQSPGMHFEVPRMDGPSKTATFEVHDDHVDLFFDRTRLHKRT